MKLDFSVVMGLLLTYLLVSLCKPLTGDRICIVCGGMTRYHGI